MKENTFNLLVNHSISADVCHGVAEGWYWNEGSFDPWVRLAFSVLLLVVKSQCWLHGCVVRLNACADQTLQRLQTLSSLCCWTPAVKAADPAHYNQTFDSFTHMHLFHEGFFSCWKMGSGGLQIDFILLSSVLTLFFNPLYFHFTK